MSRLKALCFHFSADVVKIDVVIGNVLDVILLARSLPETDLEAGSPDLLGSESYEWDAPANLDDFFTRIYRYISEFYLDSYHSFNSFRMSDRL